MPDKNHIYSQFKFMLEWDGIDGKSICAGFQEISGIAMEATVAEYREGGGNYSEPIKVSGAAATSNITFKRGIEDSLELQEWFDNVRTGLQKRLQNVTVTPLGDDQAVRNLLERRIV